MARSRTPAVCHPHHDGIAFHPGPGGTAAPSYKGAKLENGMQVQVPPFINAGARIVISTEDGAYVRRAE